MWSNKLWFRVISALNNKNEFKKAKKELEEIFERCVTAEDKGSYYYMLGYIYYINDREIKALHLFKLAKEYDPKRDIDNDIDECQSFINDWLNKLKELSDKIIKTAVDYLKKIPQKEKIRPTENQFVTLLSYIPVERKLSLIDNTVDSKKIFAKYETEKEKQEVRKLFDNIEIKNIKTFKKETANRCIMYKKYDDVLQYLSGKESIINSLKGNGKECFEVCMLYVDTVKYLVPDNSIIAWDLSEMFGMLRKAYACDLITDSEYILEVMEISNKIKKEFSSWEDYLKSYILGAGLELFVASDFSIKIAINFMLTVLDIILQSEISKYKWIAEGRQTIKFE